MLQNETRVDQGRSHEVCRIAATSEYSYLETGRHRHEFHFEFASLYLQV
jgi:hypothetical protein